MQVLCKSTKGNAETYCCVCGQGFVMFWDRQSHCERTDALKELQTALRRQHRNQPGPEAHPQGGFLVPEWPGSNFASEAAVLGHAQSWDL